MSVESVISLNYLYNGILQNVDDGISNSMENVNHQSEENRVNDIDSSVTNGSASENETENNSATSHMEEPEKYAKLNRVMYILAINVLLLTLHTCLSVVLAVICACNGHPWYLSATCGPILVLNLFITIASRLWKYSKEKSIMQITVLRMVLVITSAEIPMYYHECSHLHKVTLWHQSRTHYKQTLHHVDDLRYLLCTVTVLQVVTQSIIQVTFIWPWPDDDTETDFILPVSLQSTMMFFALLCFISATVTFVCCNYNEELGEKYRVTIVTVVLTCFSVCSYLVDVFSDFILAATYFYSQQWLYACLTLTFIVVPGFYIIWLRHYKLVMKYPTCISLTNQPDFRDEKDIQWNPLNVVKIIFNLDPVYGYWKSIKLIAKVRQSQMNEFLDPGYSEDRKKCYAKLVKNNHTVAVSRYNECYTESIMQLILQLAILLQQCAAAGKTTVLAILSSLISLVTGTVAMFRTKWFQDNIDNEEPSEENDPPSCERIYMQFLGYLMIVGVRVDAISLAVSTFPVITTCLLIGHCTGVFLFIKFQPETSPLLYKLGQSVIYTFTPPTNTVTIEMSFLVMYLLENALLMLYSEQPIHLVFIFFNAMGIMFKLSYENSNEMCRHIIENRGIS